MTVNNDCARKYVDPNSNYNPMTDRDNGLNRISWFGFNWAQGFIAFCAHAINAPMTYLLHSIPENDERFHDKIH